MTSLASLEERMDIMNNLISLEKMELSELAQKAKVKWSIEGDENSKFFHGIINKQRNNLAIRGNIIDREWIEDPIVVKKEFISHFQSRFDTPYADRFILNMDFPNRLSLEQVQDLERLFSKEEIKEVVWNCGLDKSPRVNIDGHMSRIKSWDVVINKTHSRLSKWKMKVLSIGGRLTLLKSVLGSTPIYYMSLFKAPIHVINKLEAIRSHFFNGVDPNVQKMTFV
nr:RNA-directed DNA polymerase, eukaryota, reverse transcriptase zinc-binding domain protein [Tanacetum cinerariifolium]